LKIEKLRKILERTKNGLDSRDKDLLFSYRLIKKDKGGSRVLPYIIDLESSNGTYLNNERVQPRRYYELREKDVLKFGYSSREYVLLHDQSHSQDDDEGEEAEMDKQE